MEMISRLFKLLLCPCRVVRTFIPLRNNPYPVALACLFTLNASAALVPYYQGQGYERNEPDNPPRFIHNPGTPSVLYQNGIYQSEEAGTNDLNMAAVWQIQSSGVPVTLVDDAGGHGLRAGACVCRVSPLASINLVTIPRWDALSVAAGIIEAVNGGAKIVTMNIGYPTPDDTLRSAIQFAKDHGVLICYAVPNATGTYASLDTNIVDYPYQDHYSNVLPVTCVNLDGQHLYGTAWGDDCVAAPGRHIVVAGTYATGTSWSCPMVAGIISLAMAKHPGESPEFYIALAMSTSDFTTTTQNTPHYVRRINPLRMMQALDGMATVARTGEESYNTQ